LSNDVALSGALVHPILLSHIDVVRYLYFCVFCDRYGLRARSHLTLLQLI